MHDETRRDDQPERPEERAGRGRTQSDERGRDGTWSDAHFRERTASDSGGDDAGSPGGFEWLKIPDELDRDWLATGRLGSGSGESMLFLVRGRRPETQNEHRVIKVYHEGFRPARDIVERLKTLDEAHVVRIYYQDEIEGRWVEILEYAEPGSLDKLTADEGTPLPTERAREVIVELQAALADLKAADIVHRDIKPANILVRSLAPLNLILTDFGIASYLDGFSVRVTTESRTDAYASPEAMDGTICEVSDSWSVGILLVDLLTGRHPFAAEGSRRLVSSSEIKRRLREQDVEELVAGVPEPFLLLCRGLLRREIGNRWDSDQIGRWIGGDKTLTVIPEVPPGRPPFSFAGTGGEHYHLKDVARVLANHWPEALASYGRGELQAWLERACDQPEMLAAVREIDEAAHRGDYPFNDALFRTIIAIDPTVVPSYRGYELNDRGLGRLAREALNGEEPAAQVLREIFEFDCLSTYSAMRGASWHVRAARLWEDQVRSYVALASPVPVEARPVLEANLPIAVAAGLRGSLPGQEIWAAELRRLAQAGTLPGRYEPRWYRDDLEARIPTLTCAQLIGLRALRPFAAAEAEAEEGRRRRARDLVLGRAMKALWVIGLLVLAFLAIVGLVAVASVL